MALPSKRDNGGRGDTVDEADATIRSMRLLVRLLRRDDDGAERLLRGRPDALDALASFALDAGLAVVLMRTLGEGPLPQHFAPSLQRQLDERGARQAARHTALAAGLARIADLFDASGLPFILLKGPYLAARYYGDPQGREFVDLDLLVHRRNRANACRVLAEAGFARRSRVLGSEAVTAWFVHGFDFFAGRVNVDLHWALGRHPSLRLDESRLWARKTRFTLGGRAYDVLSDADETTLQALALLRDIERGRPKPKTVVDIVQIVTTLDATMAWDALLADAQHDGTAGPLVNALGLCLDVAAAHDLAPRLAASLAVHAALRRAPVGAAMPSQPPTARGRLARRLWAARAYDATLAGWFGWWLASLPFRHPAHGWPRPVPPPPATTR